MKEQEETLTISVADLIEKIRVQVAREMIEEIENCWFAVDMDGLQFLKDRFLKEKK